VLPPSPRARGPPWADTPWDRGFLVTPPGTRWPGTQATFLRFMVRAGGPLRTRARNPGLRAPPLEAGGPFLAHCGAADVAGQQATQTRATKDECRRWVRPQTDDIGP